jgi:hypothetical protein
MEHQRPGWLECLTCCRDPLIPMHSGKPFVGTPCSITTTTWLGRLATLRRWPPNWLIWLSPGQRGPRAAWHAITLRVISRHRAWRFRHHPRRRRCPRFIWRTIAVTIKSLSQVDEAFAWDEGEGERTRDWWLDAHRRYFAQQAKGVKGSTSTTISSLCSLSPSGRKSTRIGDPRGGSR